MKKSDRVNLSLNLQFEVARELAAFVESVGERLPRVSSGWEKIINPAYDPRIEREPIAIYRSRELTLKMSVDFDRARIALSPLTEVDRGRGFGDGIEYGVAMLFAPDISRRGFVNAISKRFKLWKVATLERQENLRQAALELQMAMKNKQIFLKGIGEIEIGDGLILDVPPIAGINCQFDGIKLAGNFPLLTPKVAAKVFNLVRDNAIEST